MRDAGGERGAANVCAHLQNVYAILRRPTATRGAAAAGATALASARAKERTSALAGVAPASRRDAPAHADRPHFSCSFAAVVELRSSFMLKIVCVIDNARMRQMFDRTIINTKEPTMRRKSGPPSRPLNFKQYCIDFKAELRSKRERGELTRGLVVECFVMIVVLCRFLLLLFLSRVVVCQKINIKPTQINFC